jgi:hypothetical protein
MDFGIASDPRLIEETPKMKNKNMNSSEQRYKSLFHTSTLHEHVQILLGNQLEVKIVIKK